MYNHHTVKHALALAPTPLQWQSLTEHLGAKKNDAA